MAYKLQNELWVPDFPDMELGSHFSVGEWNINPGGGRFIPAIREPLDLAAKAALIKRAGATHVEFHDTEAPVVQASEIAKIVQDAGLGIWMVTANLFKRPEFVCGNFGHPNKAVRDAAIRYTKEYIAAGIETFKAQICVYWNGSNGTDVPLSANYKRIYSDTAECITEIVRWMVNTYGPHRALPFCIESKMNEPRGQGVPADVGEALAIIAMLPDNVRPFVGLNPETAHSQMAGKRYAMELGLAMAADKLFHVHLNGGSQAPKFDEDRAFGDIDFGVAVETMYTLRQGGYRGMLGIDVQPLPTDENDQQAASIERSIRNARHALVCSRRINADGLYGLQLTGDQAGICDLFRNAVSPG